MNPELHITTSSPAASRSVLVIRLGNHTGRYTVSGPPGGGMPELPDVMTYDAPTTPAGLRLLDTAARLFYEHGIRGVGVELIAQDAGTTKKTLYDRFGSKDALVTVYLRRRGAQWQEHVLACLADRPDPGPDRLLAGFDAAAPWADPPTPGRALLQPLAGVGRPAPPPPP